MGVELGRFQNRKYKNHKIKMGFGTKIDKIKSKGTNKGSACFVREAEKQVSCFSRCKILKLQPCQRVVFLACTACDSIRWWIQWPGMVRL